MVPRKIVERGAAATCRSSAKSVIQPRYHRSDDPSDSTNEWLENCVAEYNSQLAVSGIETFLVEKSFQKKLVSIVFCFLNALQDVLSGLMEQFFGWDFEKNIFWGPSFRCFFQGADVEYTVA